MALLACLCRGRGPSSSDRNVKTSADQGNQAQSAHASIRPPQEAKLPYLASIELGSAASAWAVAVQGAADECSSPFCSAAITPAMGNTDHSAVAANEDLGQHFISQNSMCSTKSSAHSPRGVATCNVMATIGNDHLEGHLLPAGVDLSSLQLLLDSSYPGAMPRDGASSGAGNSSHGPRFAAGFGDEAALDTRNLTREQLVRLCAPEELTSDLSGLTVIGHGSRSVVCSALWRGARVVVKFTASPSVSPSSSAIVRQALVSKALSHPNVLQHYSVRCCRLTLPPPASAFPQSSTSTPSQGSTGGAPAVGNATTFEGATAIPPPVPASASPPACAPPALQSAEPVDCGDSEDPPFRGTAMSEPILTALGGGGGLSAAPGAESRSMASKPPTLLHLSGPGGTSATSPCATSAAITQFAGCGPPLRALGATGSETGGAGAAGGDSRREMLSGCASIDAAYEGVTASKGAFTFSLQPGLGRRTLQPPPSTSPCLRVAAEVGAGALIDGVARTEGAGESTDEVTTEMAVDAEREAPLPRSVAQGGEIEATATAAAPDSAPAPVPAGSGAAVGGTTTPGSLSFNSYEGFGNPFGSGSKHSLNLQHVATLVAAQEGEFLTAILMEHADKATLLHAVKRGLFVANRVWSARVARRALLRTALEVAFALQHLHSRSVIHGSLRPANVLLKSANIDRRGFTAKVTNFSLARVCWGTEEEHSSVVSPLQAGVGLAVPPRPESAASPGPAVGSPDSASRGTASGLPGAAKGPAGGCGGVIDLDAVAAAALPFLSPEQLSGAVGKPSDVYAFGVVLYYMATGRTPYSNVPPVDLVEGVRMGSLQPQWPEDGSEMPPLRELCSQCWRTDPRTRPTFSQVCASLQAMEHGLRQELRTTGSQASGATDSPYSSGRQTVHQPGQQTAQQALPAAGSVDSGAAVMALVSKTGRPSRAEPATLN